MKDYVTIKSKQNRYFVEGRDVVILHFLLMYKVDRDKDMNKYIIGFTSLDSVTECLNDNHVNYMINNILYSFDDNKYFNIYSNANDKIKLYYEERKLIEKIESMSLEDKIILFNKIGRLIDER